jgi:APA family basic amino acid/polyamine antiporter
MSLLVMDPGLTAALGVGLARYLLFLVGGSPTLVPGIAIASIIGLSLVSLLGMKSSARLLRWTAVAKLLAVAVLIVAAVMNRDPGAAVDTRAMVAAPTMSVLVGAIMGAFFAFGGWWDLGKMSEEIVEPRRTLPIALVGGIVVVTVVYAAVSLAFIHVMRGAQPETDEAAVAALGSALFGAGADRLLAAAVVIAVSGSLAAVLLGAPRVYLAMARSGVFPRRLVNFNMERQTAPPATFVQVGLACLLVLLGNFDQILGYFVPATVFFLGLSASAVLVLPRPAADSDVFRAPWHPLPILLFLVLVVVIVGLFAMGRPMPTLAGAVVIALGIPVSYVVLKRPAQPVNTEGT